MGRDDLTPDGQLAFWYSRYTLRQQQAGGAATAPEPLAVMSTVLDVPVFLQSHAETILTTGRCVCVWIRGVTACFGTWFETYVAPVFVHIKCLSSTSDIPLDETPLRMSPECSLPTSPLPPYREVPQRPPRVWAVRPAARLRGRPQVRPERAVRTTGRSGMAVCVCVGGGEVQGGRLCTVDICNIFAGLLELERGP